MRTLSTVIIIYCCCFVLSENLSEECVKSGTLENSLSSHTALQNRRAESSSDKYRGRLRRRTEKRKLRRKSHSRKISGGNLNQGDVSRDRKQDSEILNSRTGRAHRKIKNSEKEHGKANKNHDELNEESGAWNDWADWTKCSVTCGIGRQVRWRHCTSDKCPVQGLKRAQMKTCHFGDCPTKGVLSWFGIKS